jgi:RND superfamily putative drug exporter
MKIIDINPRSPSRPYGVQTLDNLGDVFISFVFGGEPTIKMMGLGLATAVFVDATIIRMVLVPASMRLMGNANWWLPKWLDRILPHINVEGAHPTPAPAPESARVSVND